MSGWVNTNGMRTRAGEETGLLAHIDEHRARLTATMNHGAAIQETELTFVIVPTPIDE